MNSFRFELQIQGGSSGPSQGHTLHLFLLALHTNLAAGLAKLDIYRCALGGGRSRSSYRL